MGNNKENFGSKFGIIAAAAGSAIGLGNIYRFPCEAGANGGGAFFIVYLAIVLFMGLPLMLSEFVIGRRSGKNPVGAFKALANGSKGWGVIGYLGVLAAFLILAFYSTVAGWTIDAVGKSIINYYHGLDKATIQNDFQNLLNETWQPILSEGIFIFLTAFVIVKGVTKGIEKYSKILMPILFGILIVLCIKSLTLPGAKDGLVFFLKPDFSKITGKVLINALGQAFFSLSLGMGALITYGSYIAKKDNLTSTAFAVCISDTLIAVLAGIVIFPAAFTFGIRPEAGNELAFVTLPMLFDQMAGGYFFCLIFFLLLTIAALTSSISLLEVPVLYLTEQLNMNRKKATIYTAITVFILCVISSESLHDGSPLRLFGASIFDTLDMVSSTFLLTIGGLLTVIFLGWKMKKSDFMDEYTNGGTISMRLRKPIYYIIKFLAPLAITVILISQFIK
ncbi:MAG: sodium-dependent transporter [Bacteroidales bacterium]|nr:sodium-dependent transporter [Bacteroidales bacterium]